MVSEAERPDVIRATKTWSLWSALILFWTTAVRAACPVGDLNGDCQVNSLDLAVLAEHWLTAPDLPTDLTGDSSIDMADFAVLAKGWCKSGMALAINELSASNSSCITDPQGEYDDWIEICNPGNKAINIGGMYLSDDLSDPTKWRIPADNPLSTTVAANGYLLIWADGDTGDAGLHANFRLDAAGEELTLFDIDGRTLIDNVVFDHQIPDISYGRYPDASPHWRLMAFPTPGSPNIGIYQGFVANVEFSRDSGLAHAPFSVTLATETEGATIYYTLDGSNPYSYARGIPIGATYTGPITISRTTTVKVMAWKPGWKPSDVQTRRYVFLASDVQSFSSNLPIVIIDTLGKAPGQGEETPAFACFIDTTSQGRARITDKADLVCNAGINIRGKSSAGFPKKQYHLETRDEYDQDSDVSIFGFPAESDWVIQAQYSDKSLMRNFLPYTWSNDIGRYAPRTKFVEVFLNSDYGPVSSSDYVGVYTFMERIKASTDRVNIAKLEPHHDAEPEITGGYIIKKDKLDPGEPTFHTSTGLQLIYVEPDGADITPLQQVWIKAYLDRFESVLYGANFKDPVNGYAKYIDVDSFIDHHILVELAKNIDGFRLSTYMFKDRLGKLNMGPVWDYDLSLGNANYLEGWKPDGWYNRLLGDGDYPWWRRLFQDEQFRLRYADRWYALRRNLFATSRLLGYIDDAANLLNEAQFRNFDRWRILGVYVWPNWFIATTFQEEINWMKGWLQNRLVWMDSQIATEFAAPPPVFSPQGGHAESGFNVVMTAPSGAIYYTLGGSDPRLPAGSQSTGSSSGTVLVSEDAAKRVLVPARPVSDNWKGGAAFDDSAWISGTGGVGFEASTGYEALIDIDLREQMYNGNTSCYIRIPFAVTSAQLSEFNFMTLGIRYDDGFVAYINGTEVARGNFTGTPVSTSAASAENPDSSAVMLESVGISGYINALRPGDNMLTIQGANISSSSSDFLISAQLVAGKSSSSTGSGISPTAKRYTGPITLSQTTQVKARVLSGSTWSALNEAIFAIGPVAESLRITEIMYHPPDTNEPNDPNEEFIELKNIGSQTINLNLVRFTNGVNFTFPSLELAGGQYVLVVKDQAAFSSQYPDFSGVIAGQFSGSLANDGERIRLEDAIGQTILDFKYSDNWRDITDGDGFSLTIVNAASPDPNSWGEKDSWRASAFYGGSPGWDDTGIIPEPGSVVINEVLAHSHAEAADWIELYNTTGEAINIGGWFLSDDGDDLTKYEIADDTVIAANEYLVLYEDQNFGNPSDPNCHRVFALSENGDQVYLSSAQDGVLTGYQEMEDFGASATGVSFGRYYKGSTDNYNFVAMSQNTPGSANAYPQVGPIVINEIMYNPGSGNQNEEYIELYNITAQPVSLYDYMTNEPWKFTDAIEYTFPSDPVVTMPAGGYLLVVKDLDAFAARYGAMPAEVVLGPYEGQLKNGGEKLELSMPGDVDRLGWRYYIRVDRVNFSDGSHPEDQPGGVDSWPVAADGGGLSLSRKVPGAYGNDVANWQAAAPSPGQANP
jgi:hypothetical protein